MAGNIKILHGAEQTDSTMATALVSLPDNNIATGTAINVETDDPLDVLYEVTIDPGTTVAPFLGVLYVLTSLDGTNYSDSTNYKQNAHYLGTVHLPTTDAVRSKAFSVAQACGGTLPSSFKVIFHNNTGVALNSSGSSAQYLIVYAQYT